MKNTFRNIELLAPAKDKATAFAAIDCGADAVYVGAPSFGARKNAANSLKDIEEIVNYAHKYFAKVHVTLNTILTDNELEEAFKMANNLSDIGIDALIIQDMGLLEKFINKLTSQKGLSLPQIHISTQCDNYLKEKIKFFNDIGVTRVVLARELTVEQIKEIHNFCPNLELENFIHGALCVSMSGQCYLSQFIGGRSANRGECAQPCRKMYDVIDENGNVIKKNIYPLCLKDFNGSKHIEELINAGISSFKIEGRLKDINYVKNITAYYRKLLGKGTSSGMSKYSFEPNPEKTFNRGFTDYFLKGRTECFNMESPKSRGEYIGVVKKIGKDYFEIKTSKTLNPQDGLYFNDNGCLINKAEKNENIIRVYPNKKVSLSLNDKIYRNLDTEFEKELSKPVKRQIGVNLIYKNNVITLIDEDNIQVKHSVSFNEYANNPEKMKETYIKQLSKTGESDFYVSDIKIYDTKLPFMPVSEINRLRRKLFEELMQKRIETYDKNKKYQSPMKHTQYFLSEVDYRANVYNETAKNFYENSNAKVCEYAFETKTPKRQVSLMRCKHCIKYALNMCKSPKNISIKDSKGVVYTLKFNCKNCEMEVLTPNT